MTLVGDLAETPGKNVNNDCKVWEFTIKDGVKFEDGRPITSKEIAYGIARSFDPDLTGGPTYIQEWLADTPQYDTKWDFKANKTSLPPGPDHAGRQDAALRVRQAALRPAVRGVAAVHRAAAARQGHRRRPRQAAVLVRARTRSSKNTAGVRVRCSSATSTGTRNTDPVRHQYPDKFVWSFGADPDAAANRVIADNGDDQRDARPGTACPAALVARVAGRRRAQGADAAVADAEREPADHQHPAGHRPDGPPGAQLRHRPRGPRSSPLGGSTMASPITTLMPPGTLGYQDVRRLPGRRERHVAKAKELLAGADPGAGAGRRPTPSRRPAPSSRPTWRRPASRSP